MKKVIIFTNILIILFFGFNIKKINAEESITEQSKKALQETSYAYYRKSKNIQYNTYMKTYSLSPEDITNQNKAYFVCAAYVNSVYKQALGMNLPRTSTTFAAYAKYLNDKALEEKVDPSTKGIIYFSENFSSDKNMSTTESIEAFHKELLNKLQVGDVIAYSNGTAGHVLIIYEIQ